jgi:hypothetical protein
MPHPTADDATTADDITADPEVVDWSERSRAHAIFWSPTCNPKVGMGSPLAMD